MASNVESSTEDIPPYEIVNFFYGPDIVSEFTVICRGSDFLSASSLKNSRKRVVRGRHLWLKSTRRYSMQS